MGTLCDFIEQWAEYLTHQRRLSKHTVAAYISDVRHFLAFLRTHKEENITLEHIEALTLRDARSWLASRHKDFDPKSNARSIASVRSFWRYLLKHHYIQNDTFLLLNTPKTKKTLPRPLNHEQTEFLLNHIEDEADLPWVGLRDKALVMLLYGTGLRISEALSLKQNSMNEDIVTIVGKGTKERHIPFLPEVREAIKLYLERCPFKGKDVSLFLGVRGKVMHASAAAKVLRTFRRFYNLPETLTPHALRHTCATHLMATSGDLRGIQSLLGHASLRSTQIYTDLNTKTILETYQKTHPRG